MQKDIYIYISLYISGLFIKGAVVLKNFSCKIGQLFQVPPVTFGEIAKN